MTYHVEFGTAFCYCKNFTINNIDANDGDFVDQYDHNPRNAPEYGCGNMCCDVKSPTKECLAKYGITESEYYEIAEKLAEGLHFGYCAWCA